MKSMRETYDEIYGEVERLCNKACDSVNVRKEH